MERAEARMAVANVRLQGGGNPDPRTTWLRPLSSCHAYRIVVGTFPRDSYRPEPCWAVTASITRSRLKLPGFCRGGNSRKLCSHCPT